MRYGFSYIELVLSIVIIGMVIVSVPQLLSLSVHNTKYILKSDAIFHGESYIKTMLSKPWSSPIIADYDGRVLVVDANHTHHKIDFTLFMDVSYVEDDANYEDKQVVFNMNTTSPSLSSSHIKRIKIDIDSKEHPYSTLFGFVSDAPVSHILHKEL